MIENKDFTIEQLKFIIFKLKDIVKQNNLDTKEVK